MAREAADVHGLTPDMVALIFSPHDEHSEMLPLIRRNVSLLMLSGAKSELQDLEARKNFDPFDAEYMERFGLSPQDVASQFFQSIPEAVRQAIFRAIDVSTSQPYRGKIQSGVQADIGEIIKTSIAVAETPAQLAASIRDVLGGELARSRAKMIGRTESTMALNAGHYEALQAIEASDLVLGREWLAVGDHTTRETHLAAHGQKVGKAEPFIVGGYECRYPGDVSLPAQERARCRCTTIGVIAE